MLIKQIRLKEPLLTFSYILSMKRESRLSMVLFFCQFKHIICIKLIILTTCDISKEPIKKRSKQFMYVENSLKIYTTVD